MALHQLTSFTLGVPNPAETAAYYREFGLTDEGDGWLATRDGGRQLRLVATPARRLLELRIGVDDADDLARAASRLRVLGIGFRPSDYVKDLGAFLRCSTDHHNVLVLRAPVVFPHHSSWQVNDVDEIGRGAHALLAGHPERHVWGLGRHHAGSNFFYYFKDPSGTFSEYYSDMDCVPEDQVWTPETFEGARGLFSWGPPPPPSFLHPDDLAGLMAGSHSRGA